MAVITAQQHGPIATLTLCRPSVRNAMDTALLGELLDAVMTAADDDDVAVIVFTGAGDTFSAGADLAEVMDPAGNVRRMELFAEVYAAVGTCAKVTLAAVEGYCVGGGAEVAAACDLRVASSAAQFRFPGAALGIPIGAAKLVGLVGLGAAKDLVFTSRTVAAEEAQRLGLVQRLVQPGSALSQAHALGAEIAANDAGTLRALKRSFANFSGLGDRIARENDALRAFAESDGDFSALEMVDPRVAWRAQQG